MMIDGVSEVDRIAILLDQGQSENVGVIFRLLLRVGRFVAGINNLAHADHGRSLLIVSRFLNSDFSQARRFPEWRRRPARRSPAARHGKRRSGSRAAAS